MSSPAVSHAKISARPARAQELQALAPAYGRSTPELLAKYDPSSSSSKTSQTFSADEPPTSGQLTAAYVAGLVDGEGCLWVQNKKDRWFTPRCDIGMTEKARPILEKLHKQYGGSLGSHRKATEKWEAALRWAIGGNDCKRMLTEILPFLMLKKEQARLLMSLDNEHGPTIKQLVSELNRKGPSVQESIGFARLVGGRWLTNQRDLLSPHGWGEFSETWPRSGLIRSGTAYQLPPLVRLTDATGSGSWPTPTAQDASNNGGNSQYERNSLPLNAVIGGLLNPEWVSVFMGFPADWTEV
jgi:hypothetical protein